MAVILQLCDPILLSPFEFQHTDQSVLVYLHFLLLALRCMSDGDDHFFDLRWLDVLRQTHFFLIHAVAHRLVDDCYRSLVGRSLLIIDERDVAPFHSNLVVFQYTFGCGIILCLHSLLDHLPHLGETLHSGVPELDQPVLILLLGEVCRVSGSAPDALSHETLWNYVLDAIDSPDIWRVMLWARSVLAVASTRWSRVWTRMLIDRWTTRSGTLRLTLNASATHD